MGPRRWGWGLFTTVNKVIRVVLIEEVTSKQIGRKLSRPGGSWGKSSPGPTKRQKSQDPRATVGLYTLGTARRPVWLELRKPGKSRREGGKGESHEVRGGGDPAQAGRSTEGDRL